MKCNIKGIKTRFPHFLPPEAFLLFFCHKMQYKGKWNPFSTFSIRKHWRQIGNEWKWLYQKALRGNRVISPHFLPGNTIYRETKLLSLISSKKTVPWWGPAMGGGPAIGEGGVLPSPSSSPPPTEGPGLHWDTKQPVYSTGQECEPLQQERNPEPSFRRQKRGISWL